jgi:hypothetical protein
MQAHSDFGVVVFVRFPTGDVRKYQLLKSDRMENLKRVIAATVAIRLVTQVLSCDGIDCSDRDDLSTYAHRVLDLAVFQKKSKKALQRERKRASLAGGITSLRNGTSVVSAVDFL